MTSGYGQVSDGRSETGYLANRHDAGGLRNTLVSKDWEYAGAALQGSSFYKLPRVLQWFSGNISYHRIHHLSARIPNYYLERCHQSDPSFLQVKPMTLLGSFRSLYLRLWDERTNKLVSFGYLRKRRLRP